MPQIRPYSFIKSLYRLAISSPGQIVTAALYFQTIVVKALEPTTALARYNQCPLKETALFVNTCAPEDELYRHYKIVTNVPSLTQVKHFLFACEHGVIQQTEIRIHYFNTLITPYDVLLFEGINFGTQIQCSSFHDVEDDYHVSVELNNPNSRLPANLYSLKNVKHYQLSDNLTCKGWDNKILASTHSEQLKPLQQRGVALSKLIDDVLLHSAYIKDTYDRYQSLPFNTKELQELLKMYSNEFYDLIKNYINIMYLTPPYEADRLNFAATINQATLKNGRAKFAELNNLVKKFEAYLYGVYEEYLRRIKMLGDETVIARNKVAIKTFNFYRSHAGRTFSMFGKYHLRNDEHEPPYKNIQDIAEDDPAFELREALDKQAYAILFPR